MGSKEVKTFQKKYCNEFQSNLALQRYLSNHIISYLIHSNKVYIKTYLFLFPFNFGNKTYNLVFKNCKFLFNTKDRMQILYAK